jgi:hypothetical protein
MQQLTTENIEGKRIRMIFMDDEQAIEPGTMGTVIKVDGIGQVQVKWDNGRTLSVIPEVDQFEIEDSKI